MSHDLSPLSGSSSDGDKQNLSSSPECVLLNQTIARPLLCVHSPVGLCPPKWSEYACSPTTEVVVAEQERSRHFFGGKIMGRLDLEDRDTGVWADERWAPQLQRVTKQPPSLLVSDSLVL